MEWHKVEDYPVGSDAHLINVFVAKITTELSSCKPCLQELKKTK